MDRHTNRLYVAHATVQFQIVESNAAIPTLIHAAILGSTPPNQLPNRLDMLVGGDTLKTTCIFRHNNLVSGHVRKRY